MNMFLFGIDHNTCPVGVREKITLQWEEVRRLLRVYMEAETQSTDCPGIVIISTCNRLEFYVSGESSRDNLCASLQRVISLISEKSSLSTERINSLSYSFSGRDAVEHLFFVTSGLKSMVLGETEILGQVKESYKTSKREGCTNSELNYVFQKALSVGKEVRKETGIDRKAVSVGYAAVEMAKEIFGDIAGTNVMILGAGKMSSLVTRYLVDSGVSAVIVSGRSFERAEELADKFNGKAVQFDRFTDYLHNTNIIICCTSAPHFLIKPSHIEGIRSENNELFLIDIAVPRDVDPRIKSVPGVTLLNLDDLQKVVERNLKIRREKIEKAKHLIEERLHEYEAWEKERSLITTIEKLKNKTDSICEAELKKALNRLNPNAKREREIIRAMAERIGKKILHDPIFRLKELPEEESDTYRKVLEELFRLNNKKE